MILILRLQEKQWQNTNKNNEIRIEDLDILSMNPINKAEKETEIILNIELEERKLAIYERQVKLRREKQKWKLQN